MSRWNIFNRFKSGPKDAEPGEGDLELAGERLETAEAPASREHVSFVYQKVVWTDEDEGPDDLTSDAGDGSADVLPTEQVSLNYSKVEAPQADGGGVLAQDDWDDKGDTSGNFEIQDLMSRYNNAESASSPLPGESLSLNYSKVEADQPSPVGPDEVAADPGEVDPEGLLLPAVQKVRDAAATAGDETPGDMPGADEPQTLGLELGSMKAGASEGPGEPTDPDVQKVGEPAGSSEGDTDGNDFLAWQRNKDVGNDEATTDALAFPKVEPGDEPSTLLPIGEEASAFDGKLLTAQDLQADDLQEPDLEADDLMLDT